MDLERRRVTAAAMQPTLASSARVTHLTGADQYGWWLPPLPDDLPVFVAMDRAQPRPRRSGLAVCRHRAPQPAESLDGLRVDRPAEALLACARDLSDLDLVVVVDAALHAESVTVDELQKLSQHRRRGGPRLRRVLDRCDGRSESAWETLLRELHRVCEIEVEPQREVLDADGSFVARGDSGWWAPRCSTSTTGPTTSSARRSARTASATGASVTPTG